MAELLMPRDADHIVALIQQLLAGSELPRDALPYTPEFDDLKGRFQARTKLELSNHEFWKLCGRVGKRGGFATTKRKKAPPVRRTTTEQKLEILRLFPDGIGARDDLPYTRRFDEIYRRFCELTETRFSKHEFWRAISSIAKRSRKPQPLFDVAPLGGLSPVTVQFLERMNPWWRALPGPSTPDFRRWAYHEVLKRFESGIAPVVVMQGPRQVGKTTIQHQLVERLLAAEQLSPRQILRVQFDDAPALGALKAPVEAIVRWYEDNVLGNSLNQASRSGDVVYLLFDEIQNLAQWPEQMKALVDASDARVLVTGSSALRIDRGRDSLAGRLSSIRLGPLRLHEIARLRGLSGLTPYSDVNQIDCWTEKDFWIGLGDYARRHAAALDEAFAAFSRYGGYPICHKHPRADQSVLARQIVQDVVERTICHEKAHGASEEVVRYVFTLLCRHAGERITEKKLTEQVNARLGGRVPHKEVVSALRFLERTLLICRLRPVEIGRSHRNASPTVCLCDHFLRYAVLREFVPLTPRELQGKEALAGSAGQLVEGIIGYLFASTDGIDASCLPGRSDELEVDVILTVGVTHIPIEVKYRRGGLADKDLTGIREFCRRKHHEAPFGLVVTQQRSGPVGDDVVAVPAKALLMLV